LDVSRFRGLLAISCSLLSAACAAPGASAGGTHVRVSEREYSVTPDTTQVPSGKVTFDVNNAGTMTHEMDVLRTDLPAMSIPEGAAGTVNEDSSGVKNVGEVDNLSPGKTESVTVDLQPGRYLLVCNQPGHLRLGMWSELNVR
jgi:uncharacterized cupredoxin-like copper-binding protein